MILPKCLSVKMNRVDQAGQEVRHRNSIGLHRTENVQKTPMLMKQLLVMYCNSRLYEYRVAKG